MPVPTILLHAGCTNRWPNQERQRAVKMALRTVMDRALTMLNNRTAATNIAVEIVRMLEDCELFNAGKGAVLTMKGDHELEAGVVDGSSGKYGAVVVTRSIKNPVLAAFHLLAHRHPRLLVGSAADEMAAQNGLHTVPNDYFETFEPRFQMKDCDGGDSQELGTVGAIVLDHKGSLAAAGSTGGSHGKTNGRVGDTAIIGAGLFADAGIAAVCSGAGDTILQNTTTARVAHYHSIGLPVVEAVDKALQEVASSGDSCAILALDAYGNAGIASNACSFSVALAQHGRPVTISLWPATSSIWPQAVLYEDDIVVAGLTTYPSTPGHAKIGLRRHDVCLFSLQDAELAHIMQIVKQLAVALVNAYTVRRCALVTTGCNTISLVPLHGLDADWKPVTSDVKKFYKEYPGYVSSHEGPTMSAEDLAHICSRIQEVSGIREPFDYSFHGAEPDSNLFARIIRGEISQYRVWEDHDHVAFLTPFANTPGFTVLVPRLHLSSDILSLEDESYMKLILAAKKLAGFLTKALEVPRCGMIFEGLEVDYAHVKLIPIHTRDSPEPDATEAVVPTQRTFHNLYQGFVTSLDGPTAISASDLGARAEGIRAQLPHRQVQAPRSWHSPRMQFETAMQEPWYAHILALQDELFHESCKYFRKTLGFKYALVPATTDAISSPMGLGSDSEPVSVQLMGQKTHLADSMQFALEYFLRVGRGLPGMYYVGCSFRGEDHDSMHLSQFYHVECELVGGFERGIEIAEKYIIAIIRMLLKHQGITIREITGSLDHITQLLDYYEAHDSSFPRINLEAALALPTMTGKCWRHVVPEQPSKGKTLTRAGEETLITHFGGAVWLTDMNHLSVPFYQAYTNSSHMNAKCADLLVGAGEILGLGERHYGSEDVRTALGKHKVDVAPYEWYCNMRDSVPLQTTGWGMGMERFLAWILQHDDVRDIAIIPRLKGSRFAP